MGGRGRTEGYLFRSPGASTPLQRRGAVSLPSGRGRDPTAEWLEYDICWGPLYKDGKRLTPYGGIVYSRVDGKMKDFPAKAGHLDEF